MLNTEALQKQFVAYVMALRQRYGDGNLLIVLSIIMLWLFGDTLLSALGHFLQLIFHIIEALLEHFLEKWFYVTPRQAEFIVFWSSMGVALYISWQLSSKAYRRLKSAYAATKLNWQTMPKKSRYITLVCIAFVLAITNM